MQAPQLLNRKSSGLSGRVHITYHYERTGTKE